MSATASAIPTPIRPASRAADVATPRAAGLSLTERVAGQEQLLPAPLLGLLVSLHRAIEPERRARLLDIAEKMHNGFRAMGFDTGVSVTPVVPVHIGDQVKCFRFWRALHEAGVFANPVIPPAVEQGHALIRTSYMATHTDAQLDRVLDIFETIGRKLNVIPETRPTVYEPVQIARPGTRILANRASEKWSAGSAGLLADKGGITLDQLSRMSSREVAGRLFDAVEQLTWRAANLQPEDLRKLGSAPMKLWEKRGELPGLLLEKGAHFFMRNGAHSDRN